MEVKLIAMTDVVMPGENPAKAGLYGETFAAAHVCDHAARACTSADLKPMLTEDDTYFFWEDDDKKALKASIRSGHTSILEHVTYTFEIKGVSRVLETQLVRHRIGASFAIQSGRYVAKGPTDMVIPQSIEDAMADDRENGNGYLDEVFDRYKEAVDELATSLKMVGVKDQDVRYFYPQGAKTNIVMTMNGRELLHWLSLRLCTRAQKEHRELAEKILKICKEVSPTIFENAGPSCVRDGFCREQKSCGRAPKLERVMEVMEEIDGLADIRDMQRTAERECH